MPANFSETRKSQRTRPICSWDHAPQQRAAERLAAALDGRHGKAEHPELPFLLQEIAADRDQGIDAQAE